MKKAIIGIYYKDKEQALKKAKEKSRLIGHKFEAIESYKGFLVVSKRQSDV